MTVDEIVELVEERGLHIEVSYLGVPSIVGPSEEVTPALLAVLKLYRDEIVQALRPAPPREWLWRFGQQYREDPRDTTYGHEDRHPVGAWWWRRMGDTGWRPVPGRTPPGARLPEGEVAHEEGGQLGPGPGPDGDPGGTTGGPDAGDAAGREPGSAGRDSQPGTPEHALAAP